MRITDKQELFCQYYAFSFNATKSYLKAYNCSYNSARTESSRLLKKPKIRQLIDDFTEIRIYNHINRIQRLVQIHINIAFGSVTDYIDFGNFRTENIKLQPYFFQMDHSAIKEIRIDKNGNVTCFKMHDKFKSLDFLWEYSKLVERIQSNTDEMEIDKQEYCCTVINFADRLRQYQKRFKPKVA